MISPQLLKDDAKLHVDDLKTALEHLHPDAKVALQRKCRGGRAADAGCTSDDVLLPAATPVTPALSYAAATSAAAKK